MASCSKEKEADVPATTEIKFSETLPIEIILGETKNVTLSGGNSKSYSVQNDHTNIIQSNINGNTLIIKGLNVGEATLKISSGDKTSELKVKITAPEIKTSLTETFINLSSSETQEIVLSGGDGKIYTVEVVDTNIATATISGNKVTIIPVNQGSTILHIKSGDKTIGIKLDISTPAITLSEASIRLLTDTTKEITLGGGNGKTYIAKVQDESIANATIKNNNLIIKALTQGNTTITITSAGRNIDLNVNILPTLKEIGFYNLDGTVVLESKYKISNSRFYHISDLTGGTPSNKYIRLNFINSSSIIGNEYDYSVTTKGLDLTSGTYKVVLERLSDGTAQLRYGNYFFVTKVVN